MELCKQLQAEDTVPIHTFEDATVYTRLRFSLLASTWLPRPLRVLLWSLFHITLLVCVPLLLLVAVTLELLVPFSLDALFMIIRLPALALFASMVIAFIPCFLVVTALEWIWRVATRQCRTVPATVQAQREPGFARSPHQVGTGRHADVNGRRRDEDDEDCLWSAIRFPFATVACAKELEFEWGPYWRLKLGSWCREVAILDDAIAI